MSFTITGRAVGQIGFGMISLMHPGKKIATEHAIVTLKAALDAGANFWNAGIIYGTAEYNSLHLLGRYFKQYPGDAEKVVISVKGCMDMRAAQPRNDAASVKAEIEKCLAILNGKCRIDIFQPARLDPDVPVEETVRAIAEFVQSGKIGGVGLSECSAASIRKAAAVTPLAAVEVELSLFETGILHNGVAEACKEFGIPIVAYSPLSRGFLTGQLRKYDDLPADDFRHMFPRFQREVFDQNVKLVDEVEKVAQKKGCTMVQVAIAWVTAQSEVIGVPVMPIPGASSVSRVQENLKIIQLTDEDLQDIHTALKTCEIKGGRYPAKFARLTEV